MNMDPVIKENPQDGPIDVALMDVPSAEGSQQLRLAQILPLHEATADYNRSRAGRPTGVVGKDGVIKKRATVDDLRYRVKILEEQIRFVDEDPIVKAATMGAPAPDLFKLLQIRAARAVATLEFHRVELEKIGRDTSPIVSRQLKAMDKVADYAAKLATLTASKLDLKSPDFQKIFELWVEIINGVVRDTMSTEQADIFINRFSTAMDDWEERAADIIR